jgi:hypothetical protein
LFLLEKRGGGGGGGFLSALTYCNQSIAKAIDKLLSPSGVKAPGLRGTGFGGWGQLPVGVAIYLSKVLLRYQKIKNKKLPKLSKHANLQYYKLLITCQSFQSAWIYISIFEYLDPSCLGDLYYLSINMNLKFRATSYSKIFLKKTVYLFVSLFD